MVLNIQMLRAFAAMLVVLLHLGPHYRDAGGGFTALSEFAKWGFIGVDIFFVISGFVISCTIFPKKRNIHSAGIYVRHRLSRIYLGYWPFALLAVFVLPLQSADNLVNVSMLKTLTLTSGDLMSLALPVAQSLSFELYFYMFFGLLFCFSNNVIKNVVLAALVMLLLRTLLIDIDPTSNWAFWLSAFMLEFFFGVLIFLNRDLLSQLRWVIPTLSVLAVGLWLGVSNQLEPDTRVLFFGTSAASIVILALQLEVNNVFIAPRWLVSLGDSSYALYLSHLLLITAFYTLGLRDMLASQPQILKELGFLTFLVLMPVTSHLYYRYIERPIYLKAIGLTLPVRRGRR